MASSVSGVGGQSSQGTSKSDAFSKLDMDQFIQMMIAQLQNQDPMEPVSNSELLQQVSQMRSIASTDKLDSTLEAVILGQNLATAGGLLQRTINALDDEGNRVTGKVDRVTVEDGLPKLHIGDSIVSVQNVTEILADGAATDASAAGE